jgi:prepilin-type N-terminal cleavage/methylation domain-containing protein
MKCASHIASVRRGFTLVELIVAMVVLGIALTGMFPIITLLSRDIQPIRSTTTPRTYYLTPARDWDPDLTKEYDPLKIRHTWYLTCYGDPWNRKLGAAARITSDSSAFSASSPLSIETSLLSADNSGGATVYSETNTDTNLWTTGTVTSSVTERQTYRYHTTLVTNAYSASAIWSLTVPTAGWYSIQATWPTGALTPLATPTYVVSLISAGTSYSYSVDQADTSSYVTDSAGTKWYKISTSPIYLTADTLTITMNVPVIGSTSSYVLADGVRLVHNDVTLTTLTREPNSEEVTAKATVTVQIPK